MRCVRSRSRGQDCVFGGSSPEVGPGVRSNCLPRRLLIESLHWRSRAVGRSRKHCSTKPATINTNTDNILTQKLMSTVFATSCAKCKNSQGYSRARTCSDRVIQPVTVRRWMKKDKLGLTPQTSTPQKRTKPYTHTTATEKQAWATAPETDPIRYDCAPKAKTAYSQKLNGH